MARALAPTLPTVADVVIQAIFPWCFTHDMYVKRPEFVDTLVGFVRSRPAQPLDAFLAQTDAAAHGGRSTSSCATARETHDGRPASVPSGAFAHFAFHQRDVLRETCGTGRLAMPSVQGMSRDGLSHGRSHP